MTDTFSKLNEVNPVPKVTALYVETIVLENWIVAYGVPDVIFTDNEQ